MGSDSSTATAANGTDALLDSLVSGERGGKLRTQLAGRFPECSSDQIEDALQYGCKSFLDEAEDVAGPGAIYKWIRTAAFRYLNREADRHRRELAVDPVEDGIATFAADEPGPVEELIAQEDDADLAMLVGEVSSSLSDRRRDVLALYGAGYRRQQIAERLGLTERTVKRDIREIVDLARATLARFAGGGCDLGEPLVVRLVCGISTPEESAQAREHLAHCERCGLLSEKLTAWREKAGAMLPAPVAEGVSPGVLERLAHRSAEGLSSLKQHVLDGGTQIKQHATTSYYRAVDPTPLAAARPGTVGAVIASCIAIGGGATYCAHEGIVDSIGAAAAGLVASESEDEPEPAVAPETQGPTYTPVEPPVEEAPAPEPAPQPAPSEPEPAPQAEPEPQPEEFEPSPQASEPAPEPEPAPAPPSSGHQFGGP
jgi:RNA polymerase sigma factor (sigma-70 family)